MFGRQQPSQQPSPEGEPQPAEHPFRKQAERMVDRVIKNGPPKEVIGPNDMRTQQSFEQQKRQMVWDQYIELAGVYVDEGFGEEAGKMAREDMIIKVADSQQIEAIADS